MTNPFFKNYGPIYLKDIYKVLGIKNDNYNKKTKIFLLTSILEKRLLLLALL